MAKSKQNNTICIWISCLENLPFSGSTAPASSQTFVVVKKIIWRQAKFKKKEENRKWLHMPENKWEELKTYFRRTLNDKISPLSSDCSLIEMWAFFPSIPQKLSALYPFNPPGVILSE